VILIPNALDAAKHITIEAPIIGLVFPNYFGNLPPKVREFIHKTDFEDAEYIFSVVCGGAGHGLCPGQLRQLFADKGKQLDYVNSISGLSNYIVGWYYEMVVKKDKRKEKALLNLNQRAREISGEIAERERSIKKDQHVLYWISQVLTSRGIIQDTRSWDRDFCVDNHCGGCGICTKVCQMHNIKMKEKKPEHGHNCQRCMACIQYCPKSAICFRGKPVKKTRYFHPDYPASAIIKRIGH
jgi:NAD-dependent dihydropyrimidine dehydrogenase PreA subunit